RKQNLTFEQSAHAVCYAADALFRRVRQAAGRLADGAARASQQPRVVDVPGRAVERAGELHRNRDAAGERSLRQIVDAVVADVQVARAADAQQGRLRLQVVIVGDAVLDRKTGAQIREVRLLGRIVLGGLRGERRFHVARGI